MTRDERRPVKVAILGGGGGGLAAAWALTADPERARQFDVTVYQMGWRLGGKGASGRNAERGQRIEEHGLHMWFGFYENAFRLMRDCYAAWPALRPELRPELRDCLGGAFLPQRDYVLNERRTGPAPAWVPWRLRLPDLPGKPGDGRRVRFRDSLAFAKLSTLIELATSIERPAGGLEGGGLEGLPATDAPTPADASERRLLESLQRHYGGAPGGDLESNSARLLPSTFLHAARELLSGGASASALLPAADTPDAPEALGLGGHLRRLRFRALVKAAAACFRFARQALRPAAATLPNHEALRRLLMTVDCVAAMLTGLDRDLFGADRSFKQLDDKDLYDWLIQHGADPTTIRANPIVRFAYSVVFAFAAGDPERPLLAAGSALQGLLRLFLTYKGALAYRMCSGMGDVVFSPLYDVLRARGVKFRFFHRVDGLVLADREVGPVVDEIKLTRQVRLLDPDGVYDPLVTVQGLPSWPSQPDFAQIADGERVEAAMRSGRVNLEAPRERTDPAPGEEAFSLRRGQGFDEVVLAIPVGALPGLTADFVGRGGAFGERWRQMLDQVGKAGTVGTAGMQVWFRSGLAALGAEEPAPVWGTYVPFLDTYADMSDALAVEEHGGDEDPPRQLAYFCGVLPYAGDDEAEALALVKRAGRVLLENDAGRIWRGFGRGRDARWDTLHCRPGAPRNGAAEIEAATAAALADQYFRANILPSERYTTSFPGSTRHRLPPALPEVANLFLAGDWTDNPLNVGCVEATVMSGLMAARALASDPTILVAGESDDYLWLGADLDDSDEEAAPPPSAPGRPPQSISTPTSTVKL